MLCSHCQHGQDKTVLSCLCRLCEQNWQQVKIVGDRKFQICFVQWQNAVRTTENSLDLSPFLFAPSTQTSQESLVCPCQWCELDIIIMNICPLAVMSVLLRSVTGIQFLHHSIVYTTCSLCFMISWLQPYSNCVRSQMLTQNVNSVVYYATKAAQQNTTTQNTWNHTQ